MKNFIMLALCATLALLIAPALVAQPPNIYDCNGDEDEGHHRQHDFPDDSCTESVNPHYPRFETVDQEGGPSTLCHDRTTRCDSCKVCCKAQRDEAIECYCAGWDVFCKFAANQRESHCKNHQCPGFFAGVGSEHC